MITGSLVTCSILLCLALVMGFRLLNTLRADSRSGEPGERSPGFYAPMERLLAEGDFRYLATRAEIPRASISRMRKERRRVFRKYLNCLAMDFSHITREIRMLMVQSTVPRPDLFATLVRARAIFALSMLALDARLLLHACGIHGITISASRLTHGLAQMQFELRQLSPSVAFSA